MEPKDTQATLEMAFKSITKPQLEEAVTNIQNWKAIDPNKIPSTHHKRHLWNYLYEIFIYYQKKRSNDTSDYRLIRLVSIVQITNNLFAHCMRNNIITSEQKRCRKEAQGCKAQITTDTIIIGQAITQAKKSLQKSI